MRPSNLYGAWTDPTLCMAEEFHRMSYILFRIGGESDEILGARCPEMPLVPVGENLSGVLGLSREAEMYIHNPTDRTPLFVMGRLGVGLLLKTYERQAGIGLYMHIHGRPRSLARLLCAGALGVGDYRLSERVYSERAALTAEDEDSYAPLADAWSILSRHLGGGWVPASESGRILRTELEDTVTRLCKFIDCGVTFKDLPVDGVYDRDGDRLWQAKVKEVRYYRPLLLEAVLLCLFTEVRTLSRTREATCSVSTVGGIDGENLSLSLHIPVDDTASRALDDGREGILHRYLSWIAEVYGLVIQTDIRIEPGTSRRAHPPREMCVTLEWLTDPAVLVSSDLKSRPRL